MKLFAKIQKLPNIHVCIVERGICVEYKPFLCFPLFLSIMKSAFSTKLIYWLLGQFERHTTIIFSIVYRLFLTVLSLSVHEKIKMSWLSWFTRLSENHACMHIRIKLKQLPLHVHSFLFIQVRDCALPKKLFKTYDYMHIEKKRKDCSNVFRARTIEEPAADFMPLSCYL
jgi:hypothetical protein